MRHLQIPLSILRLLTESRPFTNYVRYGLLLLMFSFVGGALVELILPLDTKKYLYRAVVLIPGFILLPVQLAQKKFHVFLLPACYLLFGTISTCWSYPHGYQQLLSVFEYSLYAISFLAIITYAYDHYKSLENHFLLLFNLTTIAVISDIVHYAFFQGGNRLSGSLGTLNPGIGAMIYAICALLALQQIKKQKVLLNLESFMLLFAVFTSITALFLTGSRASLLSLLVASFILCLIQRRARIYVLSFGVFLAAVFTGLLINNFKHPESRFEKPLEQMVERSTVSNRLPIWQRHLSLMDSGAFFYGRGISVNDNSIYNEKKRHPHNLFLSSFYYLGGVGLLLHLVMFSRIVIQSYSDFINNSFLLPCLLSLSFLPSIFGGIGIHPYLDGISPELLTFWFIYAISCIKMISWRTSNQ